MQHGTQSCKQEPLMKLQQNILTERNKQKEKVQLVVDSVMQHAYNQYFEEDNSSIKRQHFFGLYQKQLIQRFLYNQKLGDRQFSFTIQPKSRNFQVLEVQAVYRFYTMSIVVLNVHNQSKVHQISSVFSGTFSSIFKLKDKTGKYAVKCTNYKVDSFQEIFSHVVKEYFILTLASVAKASQTTQNIYGFDIIVYSDCIQFFTQFCNNDRRQVQKMKGDLKYALQALHCLSIVHCDIKPQNISFSENLQKYVLIDYGLSSIVKQRVGEKTTTAFKGTLEYCSSEMSECFYNRSVGLVDLYFNDVVAVKSSLQSIQNKKVAKCNEIWLQHFQNFQVEQDQKYEPSYEGDEEWEQLVKLKYILSTQNNNVMSRRTTWLPEMTYKTVTNFDQLLAFARLIPFSRQIYTLVKDCINFGKTYKLDKFQELRAVNPMKQTFHFFSFEASAPEQAFDQQFLTRYTGIYCPLQPIPFCQTLCQSIAKRQQKQQITLGQLQICSRLVAFQNMSCSVAQKLQLCQLINNHLHLQCQSSETYKQCVSYLFETCKKEPMSSQKASIFISILATLVILQVKPQTEIVSLFEQAIDSNLSKIDKFKVINAMIGGLLWNNQKYCSKYDSGYLLRRFTEIVQKFISDECGFTFLEYRVKQQLQLLVDCLKSSAGYLGLLKSIPLQIIEFIQVYLECYVLSTLLGFLHLRCLQSRWVDNLYRVIEQNFLNYFELKRNQNLFEYPFVYLARYFLNHYQIGLSLFICNKLEKLSQVSQGIRFRVLFQKQVILMQSKAKYQSQDSIILKCVDLVSEGGQLWNYYQFVSILYSQSQAESSASLKQQHREPLQTIKQYIKNCSFLDEITNVLTNNHQVHEISQKIRMLTEIVLYLALTTNLQVRTQQIYKMLASKLKSVYCISCKYYSFIFLLALRQISRSEDIFEYISDYLPIMIREQKHKQPMTAVTKFILHNLLRIKKLSGLRLSQQDSFGINSLICYWLQVSETSIVFFEKHFRQVLIQLFSHFFTYNLFIDCHILVYRLLNSLEQVTITEEYLDILQAIAHQLWNRFASLGYNGSQIYTFHRLWIFGEPLNKNENFCALFFMSVYCRCDVIDEQMVANYLDLLKFCDVSTRNRTLVIYYQKVLTQRAVCQKQTISQRKYRFVYKRLRKIIEFQGRNIAKISKEVPLNYKKVLIRVPKSRKDKDRQKIGLLSKKLDNSFPKANKSDIF